MKLKKVMLIKLLYCLTALLIVPISAAKNPNHIPQLAGLDLIDNTQVTEPYSILLNTKFTPQLDIYRYENFNLTILNKENPDAILFQATKAAAPKKNANGPKNVNKHYPWWSSSSSIPQLLQTLDFSKVDGKSSMYQLGNNFRLRLLSQQGRWGIVYVLEHLPNKATVAKNICAVKLILTRPEREMDISTFRKRHQQEIDNNIKIDHLALDIAAKPFGVIQHDIDRYLLFLEYGDNAHQRFKQQPIDTTIDQLYQFMKEVNTFHLAGYAHGDLKIDNMLFMKDKIKLCDWLSFTEVYETPVKGFKYIGDNLPPEAIRNLYFKHDNQLTYSIVTINGQKKNYFLHPVACDRFCLGISLLEILAPDLYESFISLIPKGFNPWNPDSLDFWEKYVTSLEKLQNELLLRAKKSDNIKKKKILEQIAEYINAEPMRRNSHLDGLSSNE